MSYSQCQTAQSSSFPRALLRPGFFSSLSLLSVGWVERQRNPSPALAGPGSMGFAHGAQPILRNSYFPFFRSWDFLVPGFFLPFVPSQLPIPDRGDGGAPGGGILYYPVARVIARRHVCEAWAVPRNRNGASRRSTVKVLGPLRARPRSCLRLGSRSEPPGHGLRAAAGTPHPAPPSGNASRKRPSMSGIFGI
jgi:hypothetical protein